MKTGKLKGSIWNCLAGTGRGILLAVVLLLAYMVIFSSWLTGASLPHVPARRLPLTLLITLRNWLASAKLRIIPAGVLLLALIVVSAGTTLGQQQQPYLKALPGDGTEGERNAQGHLLLEISPGTTITFTLVFVGNPVDHDNIACGDFLQVHMHSGAIIEYLEFNTHSYSYDTDANNDGTCDDGEWDYLWGNTGTVTVAADAPNIANVGISYEVDKKHRRKIAPRTVIRMDINDVVPPTPTPTLTPTHAYTYAHASHAYTYAHASHAYTYARRLPPNAYTYLRHAYTPTPTPTPRLHHAYTYAHAYTHAYDAYSDAYLPTPIPPTIQIIRQDLRFRF